MIGRSAVPQLQSPTITIVLQDENEADGQPLTFEVEASDGER